MLFIERTSMSDKNNILEGLRGISALSVVMHNFIAAFLPGMLRYNFPTIFKVDLKSNIIFKISTLPILNIFYNGNFAVLIFFVLSGYVLTLPYYQMSNQQANQILMKRLLARYFRLNIPIFTAILIAYIIYLSNLYFNCEAAYLSGSTNWLNYFYPAGLTIMDFIEEVTYKAILFGNGLWIPTLWTLKVEFIGSIYLLIFYIFTPKKYNIILFGIILLLIYIIYHEHAIYFYALFFGSLLNNLQCIKYINIDKIKPYFFIIGLYFGGFRFESSIYNFLPLIVIKNNIWYTQIFYNTIGALFVVISLLQGFAAKFFECRCMQFLGKVSFSIYLLHFIVLCSFSSFIYIKLPQENFYLGLNFLCYIIINLIIANLFAKFIDKQSVYLAHKFGFKMLSIGLKP